MIFNHFAVLGGEDAGLLDTYLAADRAQGEEQARRAESATAAVANR
jgi:hypothetical protein